MTIHSLFAFGLMVFLALACGGSGDGSSNKDCRKLCEKIIGCQENDPRELACQWVLDGDEDFCRDACEENVDDSDLRADCVECLADRLSCGGTASVRPCDADCEPTMYVTGLDGEGAAEYAFTTYYCDDPVDVDIDDD